MGHAWLGLRSKLNDDGVEINQSLVKSCKLHTSDLNFAVTEKAKSLIPRERKPDPESDPKTRKNRKRWARMV